MQLSDCVIGAGSVVARGAQIRNSLLLPGAVLEEHVTCDSSIIGQDARIGRDATCENLTVIGREAVIAAGEHLDSARVPV